MKIDADVNGGVADEDLFLTRCCPLLRTRQPRVLANADAARLEILLEPPGETAGGGNGVDEDGSFSASVFTEERLDLFEVCFDPCFDGHIGTSVVQVQIAWLQDTAEAFPRLRDVAALDPAIA